jgi:hypothetical protein
MPRESDFEDAWKRIPHLRFGRTYRFRAEAIERWLKEEERGNGSS